MGVIIGNTMTCKECRWWNTGFSPRYLPFGYCQHSRFQYDDGIDVQNSASDALLYWDYEGYEAGFIVGPDFGCVHWESKDAD